MIKKNAMAAAIVTAAAIMVSVSGVAAEEYSKGHGALQVFDEEGMAASPQWVQMWLFYGLLPTFALGLIFVWWRPIARWVVGGILGSLFLGDVIAGALGVPALGGWIALMHIVFWSPALYLLLTQRPFLASDEAIGFRVWTAAITGVILFSFIFDVRDAAIYLDHIAGLGLVS